jgi:hypothetical protein
VGTLKNVAASVRQRLRNRARERGDDFQDVLTRYGLERFLYRLTKSPHAGRFVLKGASLFLLWSDRPHRTTRDVDLLGSGDNSIPQMEEVFRGICDVSVEDDGLRFRPETVRGQAISREEEYVGLRMTLTGTLGNARIPIQVDIGFGDAVTPEPEIVDYPVLLSTLPAPRLRAYRRETVIAEKFQAMVELGMTNSRMKDFYDLFMIGQLFDVDGALLARAIKATFARRQMSMPEEPPAALTAAFFTDGSKQAQWSAFVRRVHAESGGSELLGLEEVVRGIERFLMPVARAAARGEEFELAWQSRGPWRTRGG